MEKFNYNQNFICEQCDKKVYKKTKDKIPRKYCSVACSQKASNGKKISEDKKIRNILVSFEKRAIKKEGCWGWNGYIAKTGYSILSSRYLNESRAHRISYILHKGKIPKGLFVLHSCHNRACTNPDHLRIGTNKENMRDKYVAKRQHFNVAKKKIDAIKIMIQSNKFSDEEISKIFKVRLTCIFAIKEKKLEGNDRYCTNLA